MASWIRESVRQVSENSDYDDPLPSKKLKEALDEASAVLGRSVQDAMYQDLEFSGITFKDRQYTLKQLQEALRRIFGHDGAALLIQRLEKVLQER